MLLIFCEKNLQRSKEISTYVNFLNITWKATENSFDTDGYLGTFLRGQENVIPRKQIFPFLSQIYQPLLI